MFASPLNKSRSDVLDVLRLFFAIWVLSAHAVIWAVYLKLLQPSSLLNQLGIWAIGLFQGQGQTHPAVLAFIGLSGYVIHRSGFRYNQKFSLNGYAIKRFFRIYPVYFFACVLGAVLWFVSYNQNTSTSALTGTEDISLIGIVIKLLGVSVFFPSFYSEVFQGNAPLVTVMVEIWLYAFYAFAAYMIMRRRGWIVLIFAVVGYLFTLGFVIIHPQYVNWWHNGSFFSYLLLWWIGAFFSAYKVQDTAYLSMSTPLLIAIFLSLFSFTSDSLVALELKKISFLIIVLVGIRFLDLKLADKTFGSVAMFGRASYSIYALHAPLLICFLIYGHSVVLSVLFVLFISIASYLLVEKPSLEYGRRLAKHF